MARDISAELAVDISEATGGGGKPYIRHGKYYELLLTRCHSKPVKMDDTKLHRFAFMEFKVLKAEPFDKGVIPTSLQSRDDGTNPNPVGSLCSHSIDFDGNGAAMAAQNVREFICGLFGVSTDELSKDDGFKTWVDLCRKEDVKVGGVDYIDPKTDKPVIATRDKIANTGCGFIISLSTSAKELKRTRGSKDLSQEQREYFTLKQWICLARPGTGINSPEIVAKRRAEILLNMPPETDDDDETENLATASTAVPQTPVPRQAPVPPQPPSNGHGLVPPTPPSDPNWPPKMPWEASSSATAEWLTGFVWSNPVNGGSNNVISEADYRAGKR